MLVGLAGLGLSGAALAMASPRFTRNRLFLALVLLAVHVGASIAYYSYSLHNIADAHGYYFDPFNLSSGPVALGSMLTLQFTQFLRHSLGASYLECFLLFQAMGFWGLILLMRTFEEIEIKMNVSGSILPNLILFLPSLQFWTAAIGKDAPVFLGTCLCTWAMVEMRKRRAALASGILVILLFRPHIALIVVVCVGIASFAHRKMSFGRKLALSGFAASAAFALALVVQKVFHVDVMDPSSLATFFSDRNDIASKIAGSTTFGNASIPVRYLSLLFRPFFFDTGGVLGAIASVENAGSIILCIYLLKNWRSIRFLSKQVLFVRFCLYFSGAMILVLGIVNYNVGTGLRQRVMVLPALLCVLVATWVRPRLHASVASGHSRSIVPDVPSGRSPAGAAG